MDKVSNTVKWTRGPWRHCAVEGGWDGVSDDGGMVLCRLVYNNPENATLIAAAPDLYEALEAICGDGRLPSVEACERGRRALALARGERGV